MKIDSAEIRTLDTFKESKVERNKQNNQVQSTSTENTRVSISENAKRKAAEMSKEDTKPRTSEGSGVRIDVRMTFNEAQTQADNVREIRKNTVNEKYKPTDV